MAETYHITVGGDRLKTIKIGKIERGTGQTVISEERGETLAKRGDYMFPNKCLVWAQRTIHGNPMKDGFPVELTTQGYTGELKGLKWGTEGGLPTEVRYLRGYPSLDVLYQEKYLNFKYNPDEESSADADWLMFPNGDVDFNETADKFLIQHLKWHAYNGNSECRNPAFYDQVFYEKVFEQQEILGTQNWDVEFEAMKIVNKIGESPDSFAASKNLLNIVKSIADETPEDKNVYAYLKFISKKRPEKFLQAIEEWKKRMQDVFSKMESYELADVSMGGTLIVKDRQGKGAKGQTKDVTILSDLTVTGNDIFEYMLQNFAEPKIYDATITLIQITDKIK